jgi:hypothetical protein
MQVLKDLADHLQERAVTRPVVLVIDGATPHLSLAAVEYTSACLQLTGCEPAKNKPF